MRTLCAGRRLEWLRYARAWSTGLLISWRVRHGRSVFPGVGRRGVSRLRRSRCCIEEGVTMIAILWGAGAVVVAVCMIAALVRPERF